MTMRYSDTEKRIVCIAHISVNLGIEKKTVIMLFIKTDLISEHCFFIKKCNKVDYFSYFCISLL